MSGSESRDEQVEVTAFGDGRFGVRSGGVQSLAYAVIGDGATWVWLDGRAYVFSSGRGPERSRRGADDELALAAPMPATVRSIAVAAGQAVRAGDVLVVLEAMKMELVVKAPRDGSVSAIHCAPGEIVQPGVPLVELS